MLCFYNRITYVSQDHSKTIKLTVRRLGLAQQNIVKWTGLASALAYVAVIAVIYGHCTPVHKNWQVVPYPGGE